ncbi:multi-sensor signal transduction histidine kinase [Ktedonobacter racemifer DSM 44963]|uniref:histidine kinase n=1 Tax=Ktedonobacter racemifer DSM 44963 TaxID=485913 RepID=D6TU49_KTERA|nr:multi-sensor signal transduction histidine kinase [Ktedonobacter racemifer DSM 44963]
MKIGAYLKNNVWLQRFGKRRQSAEQSAHKFAALYKVGTALSSELDEKKLLYLIAETACKLTGAEMAAFTLRPLNEFGQPITPATGNPFYLAAVVGVSPQQEHFFQQMSFKGEGLLAPIFWEGVPVRIADVLAHTHAFGVHHHDMSPERIKAARQAALDYAQGRITKEKLLSVGVPENHPVVRSFLGVPLLDRSSVVRGGLLLGRSVPDHFTEEDEALLLGLGTQAAIALDNARLYHSAYIHALETDAIFEHIADGVMLMDVNGCILRENQAARHIRELLQDEQNHRQEITALLAGPIQSATTERRDLNFTVTAVVNTSSNEVREYMVNVSPLHLPKASIVPMHPRNRTTMEEQSLMASGAVVVWHDVTETRRLMAYAEAEQLKDEFITIAAHELRTPLAVLKGFAQTLLVQTARGKGAELAEWQVEALQNIDQATSRMVDLASDLLDVARLQAGSLLLHFEPVDLIALLKRVVTRLQVTTECHTLTLHIFTDHFVVDIDQQRIEQVLTNIIGNAIKYSPLGGVIQIDVDAQQQNTVLVSVKDTGIGIPEQQQGQIFGRFMRADNALNEGIAGTGLGLYLCRELVERHGGHTWFESMEGEGSTFYLSFPVSSSQKAVASAELSLS